MFDNQMDIYLKIIKIVPLVQHHMKNKPVKEAYANAKTTHTTQTTGTIIKFFNSGFHWLFCGMVLVNVGCIHLNRPSCFTDVLKSHSVCTACHTFILRIQKNDQFLETICNSTRHKTSQFVGLFFAYIKSMSIKSEHIY